MRSAFEPAHQGLSSSPCLLCTKSNASHRIILRVPRNETKDEYQSISHPSYCSTFRLRSYPPFAFAKVRISVAPTYETKCARSYPKSVASSILLSALAEVRSSIVPLDVAESSSKRNITLPKLYPFKFPYVSYPALAFAKVRISALPVNVPYSTNPPIGLRLPPHTHRKYAAPSNPFCHALLLRDISIPYFYHPTFNGVIVILPWLASHSASYISYYIIQRNIIQKFNITTPLFYKLLSSVLPTTKADLMIIVFGPQVPIFLSCHLQTFLHVGIR